MGVWVKRSVTLDENVEVNLARDWPTSRNESVKRSSGIRSCLKLRVVPRVFTLVTLVNSSRMNLKSNLQPLWATMVLKGTQLPFKYACAARLRLCVSLLESSMIPSVYNQSMNCFIQLTPLNVLTALFSLREYLSSSDLYVPNTHITYGNWLPYPSLLSIVSVSMSIASIATVEKYILRYSAITSLRSTLP